ncbi:MAG TPA: protein kinase [Vicinamibacterales bacterium]|nr:protein kinase [Vicinamibacterales bacterium]
MTTNILGQTVSHYRVIEPLGEGGMGVVYRAEDVKLGRPVALKFLGPGRSQDRQMLERFMREARTASALNHPNICTIYEIDEFEGAPFIAMELLEGHTLDHRIDRRPLGINQVVDYALQICDALDAAHARGILHRDIKPANIFVTAREQVKVLDFGLAKSTETRSSGGGVLRSDAETEMLTELLSTRAGVALGTIAYMSPEQARGEDLDARSDLFSFGLVLYEMTTGQRTFQGSTSAVIFDAILNREPAAPIELNANVPAALERIIAKLLDKDREGRYHSAVDVRADLQQVKLERSTTTMGSTRTLPHAVSPSSRSGAHWPSAKSGETATAPSRRRISDAALLVGLFGVIALVAASWLFFQAGNRSAETHAPVVPITDAPAEESTPVATDAAAAAPQPPTPPAPALAPPAMPPSAAGTDSRRAASATPAPAATGAAPPAATSPAAPPAAAGDSLAEPIKIARAKADAKLFDQAVADLKAGLAASPSSPSAPSAYLLLGNILQQQGRPEDAMATYVELRSRHGRTPEAAEGTFLLADLVLQSKRNDREETARQLFTAIPSMTGSAPWAVQALLRRAALEDRARARVVDSVLGLTVPASLVSYRQVVESYPDAAGVEPALARLGEMYEDLRRYDLAGQAWLDLARKFPANTRDAAWRAGELFEKRLKDPQRMREAYSLVTTRSSHYRDAQKKLQP